MQVKTRLKRLMREQQVSGAELARAIDASYPQTLRAIRGQRNPPLHRALAIASAFEVKLEDVFWIDASSRPGQKPGCKNWILSCLLY